MKLFSKKSILSVVKIAIAILFFCESLSAQEARNALLIANGKYSYFSSLSEPIKEAENLRVALEQIGFTVKIVKNASLEAMNDALSDFEATLKKSGGTGFFHYGGHAVQVAGKNYLIPSTAEIPDERRVGTRALNVDEVMNCMVADTNIVILDSCRNNPLPAGSGRSASRGLVLSSVKPKNSIIVYSAEAGCTAQDGVFTPTLTKEITRKDVSLQAMLINVRKEVQRLTDGAQTPGEYSQMTDIVYLAGKSEPKKSSAEKPAVSNHADGITLRTATGSLKVSSETAGDIFIDGEHSGTVRAFGTLLLNNLPAGMYSVEIRGAQSFSQNVIVKENETAEVRFEPKTEHVTAKATEKGIAFTIQRPSDKSYSAGFGPVMIFKFDKNGNELARAYVFDGGEKIESNMRDERTEKVLLEMARREQVNNKKLFAAMYVIIVMSVVALVSVIALTEHLISDAALKNAACAVAVAFGLMPMFFAFKLEVDTGYYECKKMPPQIYSDIRRSVDGVSYRHDKIFKMPKMQQKILVQKKSLSDT